MFDLVTRGRNRRGDFFSNLTNEKLWDSIWDGFDSVFGDVRYTNKEGNLVYELECPGFNKDNLSVELADGILTIKGKRGEGNREREIFKRMAVSYTEEVEAEIKDGILTIIFKMPEKKSTKIEIK